MKKWMLVLTAVLCLLCAAAGAEALVDGDWEYVVLEDGTVEITECMDYGQEVIIPDSIVGKKVTSIGERAFLCTSNMTSINIPDSVERLDANPFSLCSRLKKIIVSPDHPYLATIDGVLFSKADKGLVCYPLALSASSYTIPMGIKVIGDKAFSRCTSLTNIVIPESVATIGNEAFSSCRSLTSITIPESVVNIGYMAFYRCKDLTGITIPDSVTIIGGEMFSGCSSLTSITIPEGVTAIGYGTFSGCSSLTSITIPANVTSILPNAFSACPNLTLTVPRDSYAAAYCEENGLSYTYPDALDWLAAP